MQSEDDLEKSVGKLVSAVRRDFGPHPELDTLMAYHERTLEPAEADRIQEHLIACPTCMTQLLDLVDLSSPFEGKPPSEAETAAAWRVVQARIRQDKEGSAVGIRRRLPLWAFPLAASLLLAVGLSVWVAHLRQTVEDLSQAELNAPVLDLQPFVRSEEPDASTAAPIPEVPARTRFFTLVLSPVDQVDEGIFEAEITDSAGKRVWRGQGLEPNAFGSFSLILPTRALGFGELHLRLYSMSDGHRQPIGDYDFRIRSP